MAIDKVRPREKLVEAKNDVEHNDQLSSLTRVEPISTCHDQDQSRAYGDDHTHDQDQETNQDGEVLRKDLCPSS